jgi:hypothetical protein
MSGPSREFADAQFMTSLESAMHMRPGAQCTTDWPPIICPNCWATRFVVNEHIAQCYYCAYVMTR